MFNQGLLMERHGTGGVVGSELLTCNLQLEEQEQVSA